MRTYHHARPYYRISLLAYELASGTPYVCRGALLQPEKTTSDYRTSAARLSQGPDDNLARDARNQKETVDRSRLSIRARIAIGAQFQLRAARITPKGVIGGVHHAVAVVVAVAQPEVVGQRAAVGPNMSNCLRLPGYERNLHQPDSATNREDGNGCFGAISSVSLANDIITGPAGCDD